MTTLNTNSQVPETKPTIVVDTEMTSGVHLRMSKGHMKKAKRTDDRPSGFPLRFESKEQKEEFRRAAQKRRQSLTKFLITAAELLTKETLEEKTA